MRASVVSALLFIQALSVNAFEIPFKLPFGLNVPFLKASSPDLFALHKELVSIPSITGNEHDVGLFLEKYLKERNYTVERIPSIQCLLTIANE